MNKANAVCFLLIATTAFPSVFAATWELSGRVGTEWRYFFQTPLLGIQRQNYPSIFAEPELYLEWNGGADSLTIEPYIRLDRFDAERSHFDIREFSWVHVGSDWELRTGVRKEYWGVTESQHLVDIINQDDNVEDLDAEDKLGQPMVNLSLSKSWGIVDLFLLTGFRERTFPGRIGRLRAPFVVDTDKTRYQSAAEDKHLDWAVRYSQTLDVIDFGMAHFSGTNRDPRFVPHVIPAQSENLPNEIRLIPVYDQIDQTSLDIQATLGDWLWKLEWITRKQRDGRYTAWVGGFEYTWIGFAQTAIDLSLLMEYHFDDRKDSSPNPFQNDTFFGLRLGLNDAQSSALLAGIVLDNDTQAYSFFAEGSRRLGDSWKLSLDIRFFSNLSEHDPLFVIGKDDHAQLQLEWYF